jgi:hypothetical protein
VTIGFVLCKKTHQEAIAVPNLSPWSGEGVDFPGGKAWKPGLTASRDLVPSLFLPSVVEKTQLWGEATLNVTAVCIME